MPDYFGLNRLSYNEYNLTSHFVRES